MPTQDYEKPKFFRIPAPLVKTADPSSRAF